MSMDKYCMQWLIEETQFIELLVLKTSLYTDIDNYIVLFHKTYFNITLVLSGSLEYIQHAFMLCPSWSYILDL